MKAFLAKFFWFLLPLGILFAPVLLILSGTGENFRSLDMVLKGDQKYLVGYAYHNENHRYLKWKSIVEGERKKVWAVGSSRVLQFREEMFDASFYNAGFTIRSATHVLPFLESIPKEKYPEVVLLGLDQWMFNEEWDVLQPYREPHFWKDAFQSIPSTTTLRAIYKDLLAGKYGLGVSAHRLLRSSDVYKVGLNAVVNHKGFRKDGSIDYGMQISKLLQSDSTANDYQFKETLQLIEEGTGHFRPSTQVSPYVLSEVERILEYCKEQGIFVIGILPPFTNVVHQKMQELNSYQYIDGLHPALAVPFSQYGFEVWDMTHLNTFGSGDKEAIDGYHGGEVTYLKLLLHLMEHNSRIRLYTDPGKLSEDLKSRINRYSVYAY